MIGLPTSTRVWIVAGHTDMRKGFNGLSVMVQTALESNPFCGHVFVFRGRRGDMLKVLWFEARDCCCWPSAWSAADSSGRRRKGARSRSRRRSCRCCSKASTGACRLAPTSLRSRLEARSRTRLLNARVSVNSE